MAGTLGSGWLAAVDGCAAEGFGALSAEAPCGAASAATIRPSSIRAASRQARLGQNHTVTTMAASMALAAKSAIRRWRELA